VFPAAACLHFNRNGGAAHFRAMNYSPGIGKIRTSPQVFEWSRRMVRAGRPEHQ
jgi:hypothetical protein